MSTTRELATAPKESEAKWQGNAFAKPMQEPAIEQDGAFLNRALGGVPGAPPADGAARFLRNPTLSHSANGSVRAMSLNCAQQSYGNRFTQRAIAGIQRKSAASRSIHAYGFGEARKLDSTEAADTHGSRVDAKGRDFYFEAGTSAPPTPQVHRLGSSGGIELRPKLTVGAVDDIYEREADRVTEHVMSMPAPLSANADQARVRGQSLQGDEEMSAKPPVATVTSLVQRAHSDLAATFASGPDFASRLSACGNSGGSALPAATRAFMEPRFGVDFGGVRLHTGSEAAHLSHAIGAQAFTHGQDIYLGDGKNDLESSAGKELLAHELAHTIQQGGAAPDSSGKAAVNAAGRVPSIQLQPNSGAASSNTQVPAKPATPEEKDNKEKLDAAKTPGDIKDIESYERAATYKVITDKRRLELVDILRKQFWVGPSDEYALEAIWASFADLIKVGSENMEAWRDCIEKGANLEDLPVIAALKEKFKSDIKAIVTGYLFKNRQFTMAEIQRLGLPSEKHSKSSPSTADQIGEIREMQQIALLVAKLQKSQEMVHGQILVGYDASLSSQQSGIGAGEAPSAGFDPPMFNPVFFDPFHRPTLARDPSNVFHISEPKVTPYETVKQKFDEASAAIEYWLEGYPALYAVSRGGKSADTEAFSKETDPVAARHQLGDAMLKLFQDIEGAQAKLNEGDIDPFDLTPVHAQMISGSVRGPSTVDWSRALPKGIASDLVAGHEFNKVLIDLGLQTAATALFLLAPLTGGASFFLVLAGTAVLGGKAYLSAETFAALDQAAKTNVTPGTKLVEQGQVEQAQRAMEADKIAVGLAMLAVGASAAGAAIAALRGPALVVMDKAATRMITASDLNIARSLAQRSLSGPIPEAELLQLQEVGLVARTAQRWAGYRGFEVIYRGQAAATTEILSPIARKGGIKSSVELYDMMRKQGLSDQEIANYTAKYSGEPVPGFDAPPGLKGQPLGGVGIPMSRLLNVTADFSGPEGVIYVLRLPKDVPKMIGSGGWGAQSALEQEYVTFHQIPKGYVVRTLSPKNIGPLRFDNPPGVGPSLVKPGQTK